MNKQPVMATAQLARNMCIRMAWCYRVDVRRFSFNMCDHGHIQWLKGMHKAYFHAARYIPNERKLRRQGQ
jgi:hypothetical protein